MDLSRWPFTAPVTFGLAFGVAFMIGGFLFAVPLFFEAPHPVQEICKGNCGQFSTSQYGDAELEYSAFFASLSAFGFVLAIVSHVRAGSRVDPNVALEDLAADSDPSVETWSKCLQCGAPLVSHVEKHAGFCSRCLANPASGRR